MTTMNANDQIFDNDEAARETAVAERIDRESVEGRPVTGGARRVSLWMMVASIVFAMVAVASLVTLVVGGKAAIPAVAAMLGICTVAAFPVIIATVMRFKDRVQAEDYVGD